MRPKKSISQEAIPRLTSYRPDVVAFPLLERSAGTRCLLPLPTALTVGNRSTRAMPYTARALSTFRAAGRRSRLFFNAVSMTFRSRAAVKNSRHESSAAVGAPGETCALSYAGPLGQEAGTGASGRV